PPSGGADTLTRNASPCRPLISVREAPGTTQQVTTAPSGWSKTQLAGGSWGLRLGGGVFTFLFSELFGNLRRFLPTTLGQGGPVGEQGHLIVEDLEEPAVDTDRGAALVRIDHHRPGFEGGHHRLVVG